MSERSSAALSLSLGCHCLKNIGFSRTQFTESTHFLHFCPLAVVLDQKKQKQAVLKTVLMPETCSDTELQKRKIDVTMYSHILHKIKTRCRELWISRVCWQLIFQQCKINQHTVKIALKLPWNSSLDVWVTLLKVRLEWDWTSPEESVRAQTPATLCSLRGAAQNNETAQRKTS